MIDEKLEKRANEYVSRTGNNDCTIDAYIAGATENGIIWHDLRKDPEDLPETLHPVYAKLECGTYVFAYRNKRWHGNDDGIILCHGNGKSEVIAWCEIPRFEE